jgi:hypothetical protein
MTIDLAEVREAVIPLLSDPWNMPDSAGIYYPLYPKSLERDP